MFSPFSVKAIVCAASAAALWGPTASASEPGRGLTASFETEFMQFTIDHHFSAMRMTELAAGTDVTRDADLAPHEGTSPTPGFEQSEAKSRSDTVKSLARRNNRMQREEIMMLQRMLRDWYSIEYRPKIRPQSQALLEVLDRSASGADFDHAFLEVFSRHHFSLLQPINGCLTGTELKHFDLRRLCAQMWHSQTADIDEMRHSLEKKFDIADYQPFKDQAPLEPSDSAARGQHSGGI